VTGVHPVSGEVAAWVDASSGVAGDMLLAALVDAGAPLQACQAAVDAVIPGAVRLTATAVTRAGLRATAVRPELLGPDQPDRPWPLIRDLLRSAELAEPVRTRSLAVFEALARAEGRVHGVDPEQVRFHEVGSWDSLADVVGACAALQALRVGRLVVGDLALGSGRVTTAHGVLPVPVPAVLELARGWRVGAGGDGELTTPTGMALVTTLADRQGDLPATTVRAVGIGAGRRDPSDHPNVVRVVLGDPDRDTDTSDAGPLQRLLLIETTVDDLDPRVWPTVVEDLLAAGAADVWLTPVLMKKGRPGHVLSVLAAAAVAPALRTLILHRTSALGVRQSPVARDVLDRAWADVEVAGGTVAVKVGHRAARIVHVAPEFEDVARLARRLGLPVRDMLEAAGAAASAAGLTPGSPLPASTRPDR
jgi:uncharacterized protein (TIGR00299 family) protein